jgi:glycosyltransferase involved in cell wall biosynthesis
MRPYVNEPYSEGAASHFAAGPSAVIAKGESAAASRDKHATKDLAAGQIPIRILSNIPHLENVRTEKFSVVHRFAGRRDSLWGGFVVFLQSLRADVVVLNGQETRLFVFCLFRRLFPFQRCRLVSLDTLLRRPSSWGEFVAARLKRWLLCKVDGFVLYFKDLEGYQRFYGLNSARSFYIPFKVNLPRIPAHSEVTGEGECIVTIGRSHRDIQTFVAAMRQLDYPGVLLHDEREGPLDVSNLPPNLRHEVYDVGDQRYIELARCAKLVVLPISPDCISSAGISSYLLAMAFRRCVIITDSPATRGVLTDQAIVVPPADATALANAIRRAWEDDALRERVADAGHRYVQSIGGETRLLRDIVNVCGDLVTVEGNDSCRAPCELQ